MCLSQRRPQHLGAEPIGMQNLGSIIGMLGPSAETQVVRQARVVAGQGAPGRARFPRPLLAFDGLATADRAIGVVVRNATRLNKQHIRVAR